MVLTKASQYKEPKPTIAHTIMFTEKQIKFMIIFDLLGAILFAFKGQTIIALVIGITVIIAMYYIHTNRYRK